MKHTLLLLALLCTALLTRAQRVTNVTAEQQGQELLIHYHLEADGPVEVLLYLSTDRGSRSLSASSDKLRESVFFMHRSIHISCRLFASSLPDQ